MWPFGGEIRQSSGFHVSNNARQRCGSMRRLAVNGPATLDNMFLIACWSKPPKSKLASYECNSIYLVPLPAVATQTQYLWQPAPLL